MDNPSTSQQKKNLHQEKDTPKKDMQKTDTQKKDASDKYKAKVDVPNPREDFVKKFQDERKEVSTKDAETNQSHFSVENEIAKIKIFVPFTELLKNIDLLKNTEYEYRSQISKVLKVYDDTSDSLNLQYDHPTFLFGHRVEDS